VELCLAERVAKVSAEKLDVVLICGSEMTVLFVQRLCVCVCLCVWCTESTKDVTVRSCWPPRQHPGTLINSVTLTLSYIHPKTYSLCQHPGTFINSIALKPVSHPL